MYATPMRFNKSISSNTNTQRSFFSPFFRKKKIFKSRVSFFDDFFLVRDITEQAFRINGTFCYDTFAMEILVSCLGNLSLKIFLIPKSSKCPPVVVSSCGNECNLLLQYFLRLIGLIKLQTMYKQNVQQTRAMLSRVTSPPFLFLSFLCHF